MRTDKVDRCRAEHPWHRPPSPSLHFHRLKPHFSTSAPCNYRSYSSYDDHYKNTKGIFCMTPPQPLETTYPFSLHRLVSPDTQNRQPGQAATPRRSGISCSQRHEIPALARGSAGMTMGLRSKGAQLAPMGSFGRIKDAPAVAAASCHLIPETPVAWGCFAVTAKPRPHALKGESGGPLHGVVPLERFSGPDSWARFAGFPKPSSRTSGESRADPGSLEAVGTRSTVFLVKRFAHLSRVDWF